MSTLSRLRNDDPHREGMWLSVTWRQVPSISIEFANAFERSRTGRI
jgi:hypothetical protein